eukprot:TRINITY_DN1409_c0_g1_i3.p1 TRINITY_DN1409_c0_g1~~TRINITY_DN1409_c0_g1_i3.p1  ORF type:complete len:244 (-),score=59.04 TRINITY_DN1409_c0_g1_i3:553-1284(-)
MLCCKFVFFFFFFQAEDGIRDAQESRGLGDVYKRQVSTQSTGVENRSMSAARSSSASRAPSVPPMAPWYGAPYPHHPYPDHRTMPMAPYQLAPHHYNYGDAAITHHSRVADAEHTAMSSDVRLADQEHRRMSDLALRENFERRLAELEAPIRDLKAVCEQRLQETETLRGVLPRSNGAPRADLDQIRKTNISPIYKVRLVKDLPVSTQDKLNLMHEFRMAETMDDIMREREKDYKRSLPRHVY